MADTATTFAGIHNENEFYSHHYLSEIFTGDIRDTVVRWREALDRPTPEPGYSLKRSACDPVRTSRNSLPVTR